MNLLINVERSISDSSERSFHILVKRFLRYMFKLRTELKSLVFILYDSQKALSSSLFKESVILYNEILT